MRSTQRRKLLRVPLVYSAESSELALDSVIETMMIRVAGNEPIPTDVVVSLHALHNVNGERQACNPGLLRCFVREVKFRRCNVLHPRLRAQVVLDGCQKM